MGCVKSAGAIDVGSSQMFSGEMVVVFSRFAVAQRASVPRMILQAVLALTHLCL